MQLIRYLINIFLHLDTFLDQWMNWMGAGPIYVILFVVVFCETGLVVTPFLPGDSLLFTVGALAARDNSPLNVYACMALLVVAAILGDAVNYSIGYRLGPKVFRSDTSRWLNKKHLLKAQAFYEKYGGKTIVIARFVPIIRTFAPFVAGIGKMGYRRFALFNVSGAVVWVTLLTLAGYFWGNLPFVKENFQYVIIGIIIISILPAVIEYWRERRAAARAKGEAAAPTPDAEPDA
jgi:membrane-associated protein